MVSGNEENKMKSCTDWTNQHILLGLGVCLAIGLGRPTVASEPPVTKVVKLELQDTLPMPLNRDRMTIVQSDGSRKEIPVVLEVSRYEITTDKYKDRHSVIHGPRQVYSVTLRSTDSSNSYSWSWWTFSAFGRFRLLTTGAQNYLTWVDADMVHIANVAKANDKMARLTHYYQDHGNYPDVVRVPVSSVLPEVRSWGVNAHYFDITVQSISKDKSGRWVVRISGPQSNKVYTLISDKRTEYGWRLQE